MAASAWTVYNAAKRYLVNGTLDLDTNVIKMFLAKSTSNASTFTLTAVSQITNPVSAGGYKGAVALGSKTVVVGASAKQSKWSAAPTIFTASGANIGSVMYAVLAVSGGKVICWSKLSTAAFNVTTGNTLTVNMNTLGIFTIA